MFEVVKMLTEAEWNQALANRCGTDACYKLAQARVAVVGLGGLGSNIAILLVRMGINKLHLMDFDRVELCNLHRQQYSLEQVGQLKTAALIKNLLDINPFLHYRIDNVRLTEANLAQYLSADTYICEALDSPTDKAMLTNGVLTTWPDKYLVGANGMAGAGPADIVQTRKINAHFYLCGDGCSDCSQEALVASRVALCAAQQAHVIYRLILGLE